MMDIEQAVSAYNDQRKGLAATRSKAYRKQSYILAAGAVVIAAAGLWLYFKGSEKAVIGAVLLGGTICLLFATEMLRRSAGQPGEDLQNTMRGNLFPALFSNVEDLRFQINTKGFFDEIPGGIQPDATKYEWGDLIQGKYQGQSIAINEVTIFKTTGDSDTGTRQVFKGLALRIGLDHSVPDISVSSDPDVVHRLVMEQYRIVGHDARLPFDVENFEPIYYVDCENEGFASSIFSEAGRSTFMGLHSDLTKWPIQMAATESTAYLLLSQEKDFFELPSLDRPFNTGTDGRRLQDEMQRILDLIEGVRDLLKTGTAA